MRLFRIFTAVFLIFILSYLFFVFIIPPHESVLIKYHITIQQARLLSLTVALPLVLIWSTAYFGLTKIFNYAVKIKEIKEGQGFMKLAYGLTILVTGLPLNSLMQTVVNLLARQNSTLLPMSVIVMNYILVLIPLLGYSFILLGTKHLLRNVKMSETQLSSLWRIVFICLAVLFIYTTLTNPARTVATENVLHAVFYLPDWLIVSTIILPYMFVWYIGILGAYRLRLYSRLVYGVLYQSALKYVSIGIGFVIAASISLRFLSRLNAFFQEAELKLLLLTIYLLLGIISMGYILIAVGSKKLKRIEDV